MKRLLSRWKASFATASLAQRFALASAALATAVLLLTALASIGLAALQNRDTGRRLMQRDADHSAMLAETTMRGLISRIGELADSSLLASALTDSAGRDGYLHPYLSSIHHVNAIPVAILFTDFIGGDLASNDYARFSDEDRQWLRQHLNQGTEGVVLRKGSDGPELLAVKLIRPPRTNQPEGALLFQFHLNSVLYSETVTLVWDPAAAGLPSPPAAAITAALSLPPPFDALQLRVSVEPDAGRPAVNALQLALIITLVLISAIAVMALGHRVALLLTRQLRDLESFSSEVVHKGFSAERAPVGGSDEVAGLARSINHMLDSLNAQHERLHDESERRSRLIGRYRMLIEGTNAVSWEVALPDGDYSYVSPQAERLFGFPIPDWHAPGFWRAQVHEEDIDDAQHARDEAIGGGMEYSCEYRLRSRGGDYLWVEEIGSVVRDDAHEGSVLRGIMLDISQRKAAESEIQRLAFYDPLTGLPNRRLLLDRLHKLVDASPHSIEHGAIVFIDLDNFKTINDNLGHDMGDRLLTEAAQRLQGAVRRNDLVARLGGDEFVVLLKGGRESQDVFRRNTEMVADKILAALDKPYQLQGHDYHSSASIGIYVFDTAQDSVSEMLKRADLAMYQSKAAGRNVIRFFEPSMQQQLSRRAQLEADLRRALRQREFVLHYQPQVTEAGRLLGFEVLLRWRHPRLGLVSPADFITVAEETGLIIPIGMWAVQSACERLVQWAARPQTAQLTLSVNVSARQFRHPMFVDQTLDVVKRTGVNPRRLRMELTESLLVDDVNAVIYKMKMLKSCGLSFSLDDFGTGYSSLSYLRRLPLDELKIDHSFFRNVLTVETDAAIVRTIVVLAQSLKLQLIAEGVEDERQRAFLAAHGCHAYQGYLFSMPLDEEQLTAYLQKSLPVTEGLAG